jgi:hypothetical protein
MRDGLADHGESSSSGCNGRSAPNPKSTRRADYEGPSRYHHKMKWAQMRVLLADFATGTQTRLVAIKVMRVPGNPLIKGTFWLDDVKLTLAPTAGTDH